MEVSDREGNEVEVAPVAALRQRCGFTAHPPEVLERPRLRAPHAPSWT